MLLLQPDAEQTTILSFGLSSWTSFLVSCGLPLGSKPEGEGVVAWALPVFTYIYLPYI
jgi:hypothetical protein